MTRYQDQVSVVAGYANLISIKLVFCLILCTELVIIYEIRLISWGKYTAGFRMAGHPIILVSVRLGLV